MDFGRLDHPPSQLPGIDLRWPDDDPRTWVTLRRGLESLQSLRIGVGCPVWNVKAWEGSVYPEATPSRDYLRIYAEQFNSIELNVTHYKTPDAETIQRWRESTPEDFRFNVKILQEISHRKPLGGRPELTKEFISSVMGLEDRLGISFLQLPPSFAPLDLPELKRFLASLPRDLQIAVEVRHPGFFENHRWIPALYDAVQAAGAHAVITDVAGRRDVLHTSLTSTRALVRFVGNDLHPTDHTRAAEWIERIKSWIHLGIKQIEFFVHEPNDVACPVIVGEIVDALNSAENLGLRRWRPMNQGRQLGFDIG